MLAVFAVIATCALTCVITLTRLTDRAMLTWLVQTVVDFSGAVNASEACFANAVRRTTRLLNTDALILTYVVSATAHAGLAVAACGGPFAFAFVRIDAIDAEALIEAGGVQTFVDILLAFVPAESWLTTAYIATVSCRRRRQLIIVDIAAVAEAIGTAWISRTGRLQLGALTTRKSRSAIAHLH